MEVCHHRLHHSLGRGLHELAGVMGEAGRLWRELACGGRRTFGLIAGRVVHDASDVASAECREHGVVREAVCVSRIAVGVYDIRGCGLRLRVRAVACGTISCGGGGWPGGVDACLACHGRVRTGLCWGVDLDLEALASVVPVVR